MLSRAALLSVHRPISALTARSAASAASTSETKKGAGAGGMHRLVRQEHPAKVRMGFLPDDWFTFFYNKTGVTGPYAFGVGLITYLCSKEIYVMEHEFYSGLSFGIMAIVAVKKLGPGIAAYCDKEIDKIELEWNQSRVDELKNLTDAIDEEKKEQWRAEGALLLMDAKKENVALQCEAAFRTRSMMVYEEVKKRLDYHVACRHVERRLNQKHMVNWIIDNVLKSITPTQEKETLNKCLGDLAAMAARVKIV